MRVDAGDAKLLTRTGLDWSVKYPASIAVLGRLTAKQGYLDGELCALDQNGISSFARMRAETDVRATGPKDGRACRLIDVDPKAACAGTGCA